MAESVGMQSGRLLIRSHKQLPERGEADRLCVRNVSDKQPTQRVSAGLWMPRPPRFSTCV